MLSFKNKIIIITGAASGLGLGLAIEISKREGQLILLDIDKERLERESKEKILGKYETYTCDVSDLNQLKTIFSKVEKKYGHIDYLFNNAGIGGTLPFEEATLEHWNKIINLNIYGVINGTTAIVPIMKKQKYGYIINTSSIAGLMPFKGQTLYNTTKYAITGFSLTLGKELENENIKVSIICPGMIKTRIFYKPIIGNEAPEEYVKIPKEAITVEEAVKDILKGIDRNKKIIITPRFLKKIYWMYKHFGE